MVKRMVKGRYGEGVCLELKQKGENEGLLLDFWSARICTVKVWILPRKPQREVDRKTFRSLTHLLLRLGLFRGTVL